MKLYRPMILFAITWLLGTPGTLAEPRGAPLVYIPGQDGQEIPLYEGSYALLIGASDYVNGWPKLPGVRDDLASVRQALAQQGFEITEVLNPDHTELRDAFNDFIGTHGDAEKNRLLFYFAGHGHTLELAYGGEMGYIVPVDAPNPSRNRKGFQAKALDMEQIEVYARRIQARHALFLFDSCFSGSIFVLSRAVPAHISYKAAKPVRQFITSGSAEETVPDESLFRAQFVAALKGEADVTGDGYVTGAELGMFLQDTVVNYSNGSQHPQYGKLRDPRLDKGDFVFQLAEGAEHAAKPSDPPLPNHGSDSVVRAPPPAKPWHGKLWAWFGEYWEVIFSGIGTALVVGMLGWGLKRLSSRRTAASQPTPKTEKTSESQSPAHEQASPTLRQQDQPSPGQRTVQGGDRSVNVGGDANGNVIITGDGNKVGKEK